MADSSDKLINKDLLERLPKGVFEKVILKKGGRTLDRDATKAWIEKELFEKHLPNEEFASAVHYRFPVEWPLLTKNPEVLRGTNGSLSPFQASFVYLDVGAWVGTKDPARPNNWGNQPGYPMRDFGIVCGPLVALCTFRYAYQGDHCEVWKKNRGSQNEPWKSVSALIQALSTSSGGDDNDLGEAIVRDLMLAEGNAYWLQHPEKCTIHVIMGDMHIPVLDQEIQSFGGSSQVHDPTPPFPFAQDQGQPYVLHTPEGDKTLAPPVPLREAFEPVYEKPGFVPRLGRLDLSTLEGLVKTLVGPSDAHGTDGLKKVIDFAKSIDPITGIASLPVVLPLAIGGAVPAYLSGNPSVAEGLMPIEEAKRWYRYYKEGVDKGKSADIFEEAGEHLLHFVQRLANYEEARKKGSLLSLKFLQLGDMLDFWVGFTCHYKPSDHPDIPVQTADEQGRRMLQAWTANLFQNTKQGRRVADAIDLLNLKGFYPSFLYGNHDNYLGSSGKLHYRNADGIPTPLPQRDPFYNNFGVFMEHGHQWEGSNADNASKFLPLAGTLCPLGAWVTQAAFIRPGPVRQFEGKAAGLVATMSGTFGQRMDQIIGSAVRYWRQSGDFYCYVMGHTHSACLTRVIVSSGHEDEVRRFIKKERDNSKIRVGIVKLEGSSQAIVHVDSTGLGENDIFVQIEGYKAAPKLQLTWCGALNLGGEWVALEDPYKPPAKSLSEVLKDMGGSTARLKDGLVTLNNVPPGVYEARLSLDMARGPFRNSSLLDTSTPINGLSVCRRLAVCGISMEGDAEQSEGKVFSFDPLKGFERPIFLRFAYCPLSRDQEQAYFVLHRAGALDLSQIRQSPSPFPSHRFLEHNQRFALSLARSGGGQSQGGFAGWVPPDQQPKFLPMWGRICISRLHPKQWDLTEANKKPYGDWTISAFSEQGEAMGSISFHVKKAEAHGKK